MTNAVHSCQEAKAIKATSELGRSPKQWCHVRTLLPCNKAGAHFLVRQVLRPWWCHSSGEGGGKAEMHPKWILESLLLSGKPGWPGNTATLSSMKSVPRKRWVWTSVNLRPTSPRASCLSLCTACCCHSVVKSCPTLWPYGLQHTRLPCPSYILEFAQTHGIITSQWSHPTISSSATLFFWFQSFPASGSFPMSQLFASGGQSIGVLASASVLPMNIQDWSPLGGTGWISLQPRGLSRVFSSTTIWKHPFFRAQA